MLWCGSGGGLGHWVVGGAGAVLGCTFALERLLVGIAVLVLSSWRSDSQELPEGQDSMARSVRSFP